MARLRTEHHKAFVTFLGAILVIDTFQATQPKTHRSKGCPRYVLDFSHKIRRRKRSRVATLIKISALARTERHKRTQAGRRLFVCILLHLLSQTELWDFGDASLQKEVLIPPNLLKLIRTTV